MLLWATLKHCQVESINSSLQSNVNCFHLFELIRLCHIEIGAVFNVVAFYGFGVEPYRLCIGKTGNL